MLHAHQWVSYCLIEPSKEYISKSCIDNVTCDIMCLRKTHQAWTSYRHDFYTFFSNGSKQKILHFMEIALSNSYQLLI